MLELPQLLKKYEATEADKEFMPKDTTLSPPSTNDSAINACFRTTRIFQDWYNDFFRLLETLRGRYEKDPAYTDLRSDGLFVDIKDTLSRSTHPGGGVNLGNCLDAFGRNVLDNPPWLQPEILVCIFSVDMMLLFSNRLLALVHAASAWMAEREGQTELYTQNIALFNNHMDYMTKFTTWRMEERRKMLRAVAQSRRDQVTAVYERETNSSNSNQSFVVVSTYRFEDKMSQHIQSITNARQPLTHDTTNDEVEGLRARYMEGLEQHIKRVLKPYEDVLTSWDEIITSTKSLLYPLKPSAPPQISADRRHVEHLKPDLEGVTEVAYCYSIGNDHGESEHSEWTQWNTLETDKVLPVLKLGDGGNLSATTRRIYRKVKLTGGEEKPSPGDAVILASAIKGVGELEWVNGQMT